MGYSPQYIVPSGVGLTAWGYWTYRIVRGVIAIGGVGAYWAERGLFGKITIVIWALVAVQVVLVVVFIVGMLLFLAVQACIKALRSAFGRGS